MDLLKRDISVNKFIEFHLKKHSNSLINDFLCNSDNRIKLFFQITFSLPHDQQPGKRNLQK